MLCWVPQNELIKITFPKGPNILGVFLPSPDEKIIQLPICCVF
jgi:hypothetical protein